MPPAPPHPSSDDTAAAEAGSAPACAAICRSCVSSTVTEKRRPPPRADPRSASGSLCGFCGSGPAITSSRSSAICASVSFGAAPGGLRDTSRRCRPRCSDAPSRAVSDGPSLFAARHRAAKRHPRIIAIANSRRVLHASPHLRRHRTKLRGRVVRPGNLDRCTHPTPHAANRRIREANRYFRDLGNPQGESSSAAVGMTPI